MRFTRFILESLKHPKQIGTFTESSRFLAKKMAHNLWDSFRESRFNFVFVWGILQFFI